MSRPLRDSVHIFGIHDPGGEQLMLEAGKPGWVLFTEKIGHDPGDQSSRDYSGWSDRGLGVIVRLNNGYEPEGTIPLSQHYEDFAQRAANFVANSRGCHLWIIGNEMNFLVERPSFSRGLSSQSLLDPDPLDDEPPSSARESPWRFNVLHPELDQASQLRAATDREVITPELYAQCYRLCRERIHTQPGREGDQVLVGAVAPWNNQTQYPGNPDGDWVRYFQDILKLLGPEHCDGFTLHAYTHGDDPGLVHSTAKMNPPFQDYHYHFFTYRDLMSAVPANMRHLPVYLTETDQDVAWRDENQGWVQRAYGEIDWWNNQPGNQQIRALILYRWPRLDKWTIQDKQGVVEDFRQAMGNDYRWKEQPAPPPKPAYRVTFLSGEELGQAEAGQVLSVAFRLRNDGTRTWMHSGSHPVNIGYHWETPSAEVVLVPPDQDFRSPLPRDVKPGETVEVEGVKVAVPDRTGSLRLRWDLVEEGVTWFSLEGSPERIETVQVVAPSGEPSRGAGPPEPTILDVSDRLPRDAAGFKQRPISAIHNLVINHSGGDPTLPVEEIARFHRDRGYPGIAYHYLIVLDGTILQTNPLTDTINDQGYLGSGLNVAFAGNFSEQIPNDAQLQAGASLLAWLLQEMSLSPDAIKGVSEFVPHGSPGRQWLHGRRYKDILVAKVAEIMSEAAPISGDPQAEISRLRVQVESLKAELLAKAAEGQALRDQARQLTQDLAGSQARVQELEMKVAELVAQVAAQQAEIDRLSEALGGEEPGPLPEPTQVSPPPIQDVVDSLPKHASLRYKTRHRSQATHLCIHHSAAPATISIERIAEYHVQPDPSRNKDAWPGIGYHFYVKPDGTIYQTNRIETVSYHVYQNNHYSVGICLAGDFGQVVPAPQQLKAAVHLVAWLMQELQITEEHVMGHKEYPANDTSCPGRQWLAGQRWKDSLMAAARELSLREPGRIVA